MQHPIEDAAISTKAKAYRNISSFAPNYLRLRLRDLRQNILWILIFRDLDFFGTTNFDVIKQVANFIKADLIQ